MHVNRETSIDYPAHSNKEANKQCFWLPYGQVSRYLVGLMAVGHKDDSRQHAISDSEGNFIQATTTTNYVIKVCDQQAVNYMYMQWLMAEYEYSVIQLGLCPGEGEGKNDIQYTEPYPQNIIITIFLKISLHLKIPYILANAS